MRPRRSRRAAGFTLLELVISMTLLALITGICYAAFHLGIRAVERGEVAVVTAQRLRVATDVLIRQVKSMALNPALCEGDTYPYFSATPTAMRFVTDAGQLGGGGRALVSYRFEPDPPSLVLEETPYFDAESLCDARRAPSEPRSAVVLDGFRTLTFQYLLDEGAGDTEWRSTWDYLELEVLPAAVRVVIEGLPGLDEDVWGQEIPVMVAAYGESGAELDEENEIQDCESETSAAPGADTGERDADDDREDADE